VALIAVTIGVDHRDLDAVDQADRVGAFLAIVETIVDPFDGRSVENPGRVLKGDPMSPDICGVFRRIACKPHLKALLNVFTLYEM
jgi:hypothetical protein